VGLESARQVAQGLSPQELQFVASKHMSFYRMEHYVRVLFPTVAELTPLLLSAIKIVKQDFDVPAEIQSTVQTLQQQSQNSTTLLQTLQVGNSLAAQELAELEKLRQLRQEFAPPINRQD